MTKQRPQTGREGITAIIPAFNEAATIGGVLRVLLRAQMLDQILVVNDGSTDETADKAAAFQRLDSRLSVVNLTDNQGKARAMLTGAGRAEHDILLFLDADLRGLRPEHVKQLTQPVQRDGWVMTVGLFHDGRWQTNLTHRLFPFLSGQRCLRWPLFHDLYTDHINGWSIETALNLEAWRKRYPIQYVPWEGVTHVIRTEKRGSLSGGWSHVRMWWEIGRYTAKLISNRRQPASFPAPDRVVSSTYRHEQESQLQKWPI
jgi:glycosyltransferase involved in cell wall biosynthesis